MALGVFQNVVYFTGPVTLRKWVHVLSMSPNPVVFSDLSGVANFVRWFDAEFRLKDGTSIKRYATADSYGNLPGPYQRRSIYAAALTFAPHRPEQYFYGVLQRGFCGGPLAESLGVSEPAATVQLTIPLEVTAEGTHAQLMTLRCDR